MSESASFSRSASRERLLAFAFATADLLMEIGPSGTITWAAGAFKSHFGQSADSVVGRKLTSLIASPDHDALARTLINVTLRGHTPPVVLRLNDQAKTKYALGALMLPGPHPRLCVTLGPVPTPPPAKPEGVLPAASFAREAEARLRARQASVLGLLDLKGCDATTFNAAERGALRDEIGLALGSVAGSGATVGELTQGRYGVVSQRQLDMQKLAASLQALIQAHPDGHGVSVNGAAVDMSAPGLLPAQAARALRFVLTKFAQGGADRIEAGGFAAGFAGFIEQAKGEAGALRGIITGGRFDMVFQPVVALSNRSIHHYEALLRPTAGRGTLWDTTQDFVTCAEAVGLAEELDLAVLKRVLATLARNPTCSIAANISGLSMQSDPFREHLLAALPTGSYPRLLIELTETAEIEDVAAAADTLERLQDLNIGLCIDDFGAGAAAFRYVRDFRVDYVKIDGAYVQGAARGSRERSVVASMLDLARSVGAKTIAEMIETDEQARLMQELGATFGQGWLFGQPGPLPARARA